MTPTSSIEGIQDLDTFEQIAGDLSLESLELLARKCGLAARGTAEELRRELKAFFAHQDDLPFGDESIPSLATGRSEIRIEPKDYTVRSVLTMIAEGDFRLDPEFQRRRVWTPSQKARLIESLLLGIPLPLFYAAQDSEGVSDVVDGLQRLSTIHDFEQGKIELTGLEYLKDDNGKYWDDLPRNQKRQILVATLKFYVIHHSTPKKMTIDIFNRLNTGGAPLTAQEVRHAIGGDRYRLLVRRMTENELFKSLMPSSYVEEGGSRWKRMQDREAVTRFLAFRRLEDPAEYRPSFRNFLTTSVLDLDGEPDATFATLGDEFERAIGNVAHVFGKGAVSRAFQHWPEDQVEEVSRNKAFRITLFETWLVVLAGFPRGALKGKARARRLQTLAREAMNDDSEGGYVESYTFKTTSRERIQKRFSRAWELAEDVLGPPPHGRFCPSSSDKD